jgi:hypothetical protein
VNPLATSAFDDIVGQYYLGRLRDFAAGNALFSRSEAAYAVITGAEDYVARRAKDRPKPKTTIESLFALPADWTDAQRKEWALDQYKKYIRTMEAIARPARARRTSSSRHRRWTSHDRGRRRCGRPGYKAVYEG